ncbi:hypothetical protein Mal4_04860 [Maioricimonas rarisocia]|uniref:Uncharacterized protein n=1 Tax=Maioricimonas rarisocia TaxID=2528026 RepID=A0A517Z142_9PLAN|nr:hypothetical protein [Maioricimonas rarisocia]QDU36202.1 hypothetical protein Mal4_04860 [Maioricimonas rarisocia]
MHQDASRTALRPEIRRVLDDLRGRIRRYVLIEGLSVLVVLAAALFWFGLVADVIHFDVRKLELPAWFRLGFLILGVGALLAVLVMWVLPPIVRRLRRRSLALLLEKRFPTLSDRLITAVEFGETSESSSGLGGAMLEKTIDSASRDVEQLNLSTVFDPGPLRRWVTAATILLASVVVFGVTNASAMHRWANAYLLQQDDYWEPYRRSAMSVKVVAQPGERIREFDENFEYRHPRGADLYILAEVPEGKDVPDRVEMQYRSYGNTGSSRGTVGMSALGDGEFRHVLARVIDEHQLWVTGGDFINRQPYRIVIVDPPRLDQIVLDCEYPAYTGMNAFADKERPVQGTQISLPLETKFVFRGVANKRLRRVHVRSDHVDISFGYAGPETSELDGQMTVRGGEEAGEHVIPLSAETVARFMSPENDRFEIPMQLTSSAVESLSDAGNGPPLPVPLPPDSQLQIYLEDEDDVYSTDPALVTINGIIDQAPVVDTQLRGVSTTITRLASIPIEGRITDDYGIGDVHFGFRVDEETEFTPRPIDRRPRGNKEYRLAESEDVTVERFSVLPLELKVDQRLALTVFAEDGDQLNGPHKSHGPVYSFRIVTPEELLARLYDKELNLRLRFEQIISEVRDVREDLLQHRQRYEEGASLRESTPAAEEALREQEELLRQLRIAMQACAERNLHMVRKNHTETRAVQDAFAEIRAEMVNNRVDTASILNRIDYGITAPLEQINGEDFPSVDGDLGLFRLANERETDPTEAIDDAVAHLDTMLVRMEQVLNEMRRRETFNELVKSLQSILERQAEIQAETRKEQERKLFDLLN